MAILLLISSLLSSLSLADDSADAVNERIPVSRAEMEAHWQVDCAAAWEYLLTTVRQSPDKDNCGIPDQLRQEIQLCAFIYQAPGGDPVYDCPDYRGVSKHLNEAEKSGKCPALIQQKADCRPGGQ